MKNLKFRPCGVFGLVTDSGTVVSAFGAGQLKIYTSPQRFCYSFRYPTLITILFVSIPTSQLPERTEKKH
jgi:hypothetical protein